TTIGINAFKDNSTLADVHIPEKVTDVGDGAFAGIKADSNTIVVAQETKPSGWHTNWNGGANNVQWGGDFIYELVGNTYRIVSAGSKKGSDIAIPDTYKGKKVTEIKAGAFEGHTTIRSVILGKNITTIGSSAFKKSLLEYVLIPEVVTTIGAEAFADINLNRGAIAVDSETKPTGWHTNWNGGADNVIWGGDFTYELVGEAYHITGRGSKKGSTIEIPYSHRTKNIVQINEDAFKDDTTIKSVTIAYSVTTIGSRAFKNNSSLEYVFIPIGVRKIGAEAFAGIKTELGTIVAEPEKKPSGWDENWTGGVNNVIWGGELAYELVGDKYHVTGIGRKKGSTIVIPDTHKGKN
ncbi:MAG: leucine-rich repeat domain-containing protein, partial [Bacteroidales bacterium]